MGILIKLPIFTNPTASPVVADNAGILYRETVLFLRSASKNDGLFFAVITYFFLFTQALQLNSLINKNRMMQRLNFLPATAYLVITSLMPEWNHFSAPLLVNTLVLLIFSGLFQISNQFSIKSTVYNIGVAVGISSFIFFPSIILFFWLIFRMRHHAKYVPACITNTRDISNSGIGVCRLFYLSFLIAIIKYHLSVSF